MQTVPSAGKPVVNSGAGKDATGAVPSTARKSSILSEGKHATGAKHGRTCYRCHVHLRVVYFRCALDSHVFKSKQFLCNATPKHKHGTVGLKRLRLLSLVLTLLVVLICPPHSLLYERS